ncbi:MAG: hypothetical protein Q8M16_19435 [Pirellulaceae bacterium]|nr:hypothetical protein [Pirellulaceae bacterium]
MSKTTDFTIFWNSINGQDEVAGIYLYGLFKSNRITDVGKLLGDLWTLENGEFQAKLNESRYGSVLSVSLKLHRVPLDNDWFSKLEASLTSLIENGALVAWAGGEDCSSSPEVLNPDSCVGNVYAAKTAATAFMCNDTVDGVIEILSDAQLSSLWGVVQQERAAS